LQEKNELEVSFSERLTEATAAASQRADLLRRELEGRLGSLAGKLAELAAKETRRERQRADLAQQVGAGRKRISAARVYHVTYTHTGSHTWDKRGCFSPCLCSFVHAHGEGVRMQDAL